MDEGSQELLEIDKMLLKSHWHNISQTDQFDSINISCGWNSVRNCKNLFLSQQQELEQGELELGVGLDPKTWSIQSDPLAFKFVWVFDRS